MVSLVAVVQLQLEVAEDVSVDNVTTNCRQSKDWGYEIFLHIHTDINQVESVKVNEYQSPRQQQQKVKYQQSAPEVNDDHELKVA